MAPTKLFRLSTPARFGFLSVWAIWQLAAGADAAPTVATALKLMPTQRQVSYDRPASGDIADCTIEAVKTGEASGWIVRDGGGKILRRFVDTNGDNVVDFWSYYKDGIEVFRDIDTDFNRKADQFRWLNTAGRRWAIDRDEDNRIDQWKSISAQEVTAELVLALTQKDTARFSTLLLTNDELRSLGLGAEQEKNLAEKIENAAEKFTKLVAAPGSLSEKARWVHFAAGHPGLVPAGSNESTKDLLVHENVVAMVDVNERQEFVQVGTLVQVGASWKLIDAPTTTTETTAAAAAGFFFGVANTLTQNAATTTAGTTSDAELQKLLAELEKAQRGVVDAAPTQRAKLYDRQSELLEKLVKITREEKQKGEWLRQLADTVSAAVQANEYPAGQQKLADLVAKLKADDADVAIIAYIRYREMLAAYSLALQNPKADFAKVLKDWKVNLEKFVVDYPTSNDAAEAILQLGTAHEFGGQEDAAKKWYSKVVDQFPNSPQGKKAAGARRRLESVGRPLTFSGESITGGQVDLTRYRGRTVIIQYWASWCEPCKADMAVLNRLLAKHDGRLSVIGVNVDHERTAAIASIREHKISWANIHESGGLDSRPATELGILTLPTMLLIDSQGRVANRNIHASELENELKKRIR